MPRASQEGNEWGGIKCDAFWSLQILLFLNTTAMSAQFGNSTRLEAQHLGDSGESSEEVYKLNSK